MKKLFLSFAVIAGLSMISCGNKAGNAEATDAVDTVEVLEAAEVAVDSIAPDTVAVVVDSVAAVVAE